MLFVENLEELSERNMFAHKNLGPPFDKLNILDAIYKFNIRWVM